MSGVGSMPTAGDSLASDLLLIVRHPRFDNVAEYEGAHIITIRGRTGVAGPISIAGPLDFIVGQISIELAVGDRIAAAAEEVHHG